MTHKEKIRISGPLAFMMFLCLGQFLPLQGTWEYPPLKFDQGNHPPVICHRDTSSNTTIIQIFVLSGKSAVPPEKRGLSYLTLRMGMESPYPTDIRERYLMGSQMSWNVFGDHSVITIMCLSKHLKKTTDIFFKNFLNPFLSTVRIDLVKENMVFQRQMESDNPVRLANLTAQSLLLGPLGYKNSIYGDEQSLKNIEKSDIQTHFDTHINQSNLICSVSSDLEPEKIMNILKPHLIKIPRRKQNRNPHSLPKLASPEMTHHFFKRDKEQSMIAFANGIVIRDPNQFLSCLLLESLLGKGVGSKLWDLRTRKFSYHPTAQVQLSKFSGLLMVYLKTQNSKKETAARFLKEILNQIYLDGITDDEFDTAKAYFRTVFLREIEDKEDRALRFAQFEALGLGYNSLLHLSDLLNRINLKKFNQFLKEILDPSHMIQIVIGPEDLKQTTIQAP